MTVGCVAIVLPPRLLAGELADIAKCPVDLLDIRSASTVMQSQILTQGQRLWAKDVRAGLFEAASIERCVARAREEYLVDPDGFATNHSRQDAAILNIQRACEAALDMGHLGEFAQFTRCLLLKDAATGF